MWFDLVGFGQDLEKIPIRQWRHVELEYRKIGEWWLLLVEVGSGLGWVGLGHGLGPGPVVVRIGAWAGLVVWRSRSGLILSG